MLWKLRDKQLMKYGKDLEQFAIEAHRYLYIDYKNLKKIKRAEIRKRQAIEASGKHSTLLQNDNLSSINTDSVFVPSLLKVPYHALKTDSVEVNAIETLPFGDNMFAEAFEQELEKVDRFYLMKCLETDTRINGAYCRLLNAVITLKKKKIRNVAGGQEEDSVLDIKAALNMERMEAKAISQQIKDISKFSRQNAIGFKKIAKKYNKRVCEGSLQRYLV